MLRILQKRHAIRKQRRKVLCTIAQLSDSDCAQLLLSSIYHVDGCVFGLQISLIIEINIFEFFSAMRLNHCWAKLNLALLVSALLVAIVPSANADSEPVTKDNSFPNERSLNLQMYSISAPRCTASGDIFPKFYNGLIAILVFFSLRLAQSTSLAAIWSVMKKCLASLEIAVGTRN